LTTKFIQTSAANPLTKVDTKLTYDYQNLKYRINMKQHVSFEERWSYLKVSNRYRY